MPVYQRPAFWRVPHQRRDPEDEPRNYSQKKLVRFLILIHTFIFILDV